MTVIKKMNLIPILIMFVSGVLCVADSKKELAELKPVFSASFNGTSNACLKNSSAKIIRINGSPGLYKSGPQKGKKAIYCLRDDQVYANYSLGEDFPVDAGTVSAWIKPNWNITDPVFKDERKRFNTIVFLISKDKKSRISFSRYGKRLMVYFRNPLGSCYLFAPLPEYWKKDQWKFIAFSWGKQSKELKVFFDGKLIKSRHCKFIPIQLHSIFIGINQHKVNSLDGAIAELSIYPRQLLVSEIAALAAGKSPTKDVSNVDTVKAKSSKAVDLLRNGDFEFGLNRWFFKTYRSNAYKSALDTQNAFHGDACVMLEGTSTLSKHKYESIWEVGVGVCSLSHFTKILEPGKTYTLSAYMKSNTPGMSAEVCLFETWKRIKKKVELNTEWKRYSVTGKIPVYWLPLVIPMINCRVTKGQKVWIDAVSLTEGELVPYAPQEVEIGAVTGVFANSFLPDEKTVIEAKVINNSNRTLSGLFTCEIKNIAGELVGKIEKKLNISGSKSKKVELTPNINNQGLYLCEFKVFNGKGDLLSENNFRFARIAAPKDDNGVLIGDHSSSIFFNSQQHWQNQLKFYKRFGIGLLRTFVPMFKYGTGVEYSKKDMLDDITIPGGQVDRRISMTAKAGINILLCYKPKLGEILKNGAKTGKYYSDGKVKAFAAGLKRIVEFYKGKVKYYEVMNEPDIDRSPLYKGGAMPPRTYVRFLKPAYLAAKKADPDCVVMGCDIAGLARNYRWIMNALDYGALDYLDILSFHPYQNKPEMPDYAYPLQALKDVIKTKFKKELPLWDTEGCWNRRHFPQYGIVYNDLCTRIKGKRINTRIWSRDYCLAEKELIQAAFFARMLIIGTFYGVKSHTSHALGSQGSDLSAFIDANFTPAALGLVCKAFVQRFSNVKPLKELDLGTAVRSYSFMKPDGTFIVAVWALGDQELKASLSIRDGGEIEKVFRMDGGKLNLSRSSDGKLILPLEPYPIYLVLPKNMTPSECLEKLTIDGIKKPYNIEVAVPSREELEVKIFSRLTNRQGGILRVELPKPLQLVKNEIKIDKLAKVTLVKFQIANPETWENLKKYTAKISYTPNKGKPTVQFQDFSPLFCRFIDKAFKVDGNLNDWSKIPPVTLGKERVVKEFNKGLYHSNGKDFSCDFRCAWDNDFIYLAWDVKDDVHCQKYTKKSQSIYYQGDSIQIYFDTMKNAQKGASFDDDDCIYAIWSGPKGPKIFRERAARFELSGLRDGYSEKAELAVVRNKNGHTIYELALPLSELKPLIAQKGKRAGFCFLLNDNDGVMGDNINQNGREAAISLTPKGTEPYQRPYLYTNIIFE